MFQSNRLFLGGIVLGFFIASGILFSGAVPFLSYGTILWISIAISTFIAALFLDTAGRIWIVAAATLLEGLFGGMSYSAHLVGFLGGLLAIDFLFKRFVKHHAPIADAALIAAGTVIWFFLSAVVQMFGFWLGFFRQTVSLSFIGRGVLATAVLSLLVFLILVCISNYSKYGSLMRL